MSTWYRVNSMFNTIESVKVSRFTDKTVWLANGRKRQRKKDWESFYPTLEEAQNAIIERMQTRIISTSESIRQSQQKLQRQQEELNEFRNSLASGGVRVE